MQHEDELFDRRVELEGTMTFESLVGSHACQAPTDVLFQAAVRVP